MRRNFIQNTETTEIKYFSLDEIPENLANEKSNKEQIEMCFKAYKDKNLEVIFDWITKNIVNRLMFIKINIIKLLDNKN